jgi:hypothetical protein
MASASLTQDSFGPLLAKKTRKIHRQRKIISALLDHEAKPKRRITKPPSEKQRVVRDRMRRASAKALEIYRAAPPGSMKWIDAIRQAWKLV